ncbi:unnamed protein product [Rhizophagus irregularis]|nr:unnamed protein product [Rhizophagus irregularis]
MINKSRTNQQRQILVHKHQPVGSLIGLGNKSETKNQATQILTGFKEADDQRINVMGQYYTIKLSVKRQHKYQTLRVKIVLNSFTLPQFNKFWTTDLGDIPEEMMMATLWKDHKPTTFLTSCGKRKLVGYFENWEATLKALDTPQVFLTLDKELKWCQHSVPTLKKKQHKLKTKKL